MQTQTMCVAVRLILIPLGSIAGWASCSLSYKRITSWSPVHDTLIGFAEYCTLRRLICRDSLVEPLHDRKAKLVLEDRPFFVRLVLNGVQWDLFDAVATHDILPS